MAQKARTLTPKGDKDRAYDRWRGTAAERGYDAQWQRFRRWYATQYPAICAACGHAGTSKEMHVDHIVAMSKGGEKYDMTNLQWLCQPCHTRKTRMEQSEDIRLVTLVVGPPAGGKSSFVQLHRNPGDMVWDADLIASAITGCALHQHDDHSARYLAALREAFIRCAAADTGRPRMWVIATLPDAVERDRIAKVLQANVDH